MPSTSDQLNQSDIINLCYIHIIKSYTDDFYEAKFTQSEMDNHFGIDASNQILRGVHHTLYIEQTVPGVIK